MIGRQPAASDDGRLWNDYVTSHPEANYCHLYEWSAVFERAYRSRRFEVISRSMSLIGVAAVGQFGDMVESLLKRDLAFKDSAAILPGHGGVLDRFDSLFFSVPVTYYALKFFLI